MTKEYEDLQCLYTDGEGRTAGLHPAKRMIFSLPQPSTRHLCGFLAVCIGMLFIILILVVSFRYPGEKPPDRTLEYQMGNLSNHIDFKMEQLSQEGTKSMEKFQKLENMLKEMQGTLQNSMTRTLTAISRLSDRVKKLQVNGSEDFTCPEGWKKFQLSCYFYSTSARSWAQSKKSCEEKDSHMIVLNTKEEQNFAFGITKGKYTWLGLTDDSGDWKWVDGTDYRLTPKNWRPGQPDEYYGHGLGGGEDCAHLHTNGQWNDSHCSRNYNLLCEKDM